ncbi:MAG: hypothetical protein F6K35_26355 [Okeania sp. SIO2H7]|nr:hypothetical protein [Okeania sp. SIO2H7]
MKVVISNSPKLRKFTIVYCFYFLEWGRSPIYCNFEPDNPDIELNDPHNFNRDEYGIGCE